MLNLVQQTMEDLQRNLDLIARFFGIGAVRSFSHAGGTANENYCVQTDAGRYVVKVIREHTADNVKSELPFLQRLKENDFPASYYLQSPSGEFVFEDDITAIVMDAKEGSEPTTVDVKTIQTLGEVLARLHSVPVEGLNNRSNWFAAEFVQHSLEKLADAVGVSETARYRAAFDAIGNIENIGFTQSIIHGDYHPGNCLFDQGRLVAVIDWEEVTLGSCLLDIAFTTIATCFKDSVFDIRLFLAFIDGYQAVRTLSQEERLYLCKFVRYVGLVISTWAYLRYGIHSEDPDIIKWRNTYWEFDLENWTFPDERHCEWEYR